MAFSPNQAAQALTDAQNAKEADDVKQAAAFEAAIDLGMQNLKNHDHGTIRMTIKTSDLKDAPHGVSPDAQSIVKSKYRAAGWTYVKINPEYEIPKYNSVTTRHPIAYKVTLDI